MPNQIDFQKVALETLRIEEKALEILATQIDERFSRACEIILQCRGRLVITGMGKSGHIGRKMAATFASTGTPSFFMHPGEAGHGDLGMLLLRWCCRFLQVHPLPLIYPCAHAHARAVRGRFHAPSP